MWIIAILPAIYVAVFMPCMYFLKKWVDRRIERAFAQAGIVQMRALDQGPKAESINVN
jgi:hypothetical protein